ncbi:hypothetical protein PYJP_09440 [Pyrofollis japonicus]|uniref:hypothetical protein n=1 Tax=Pyrofollis japonicus TaxID=3060460 RepID=UPI00295C0559|nr:hypothetical protein [Pyrofollis japonicus]BEP17592.1 hypothetical protein PYJP_09440 [Pyrofollis japonicus]
MSKRFLRTLAEKEVKKILLVHAKQSNVPLEEIVEWLYYEAGVKAKPSWKDVEEKILRNEIDAQAFAAFLLDYGVEINEDKWIEIINKYSGLEEPRFLRPRQKEERKQ